jgi:hypothetical protein
LFRNVIDSDDGGKAWYGLEATVLSRLKQGFDSPRAGTDIFYNDPATGSQVKMKVVDFVALYDGAANWTNNIIHNP